MQDKTARDCPKPHMVDKFTYKRLTCRSGGTLEERGYSTGSAAQHDFQEEVQRVGLSRELEYLVVQRDYALVHVLQVFFDPHKLVFSGAARLVGLYLVVQIRDLALNRVQTLVQDRLHNTTQQKHA